MNGLDQYSQGPSDQYRAPDGTAFRKPSREDLLAESWDLPAWCTCPGDCDCDGELVCAAPAGTTGIRCEQPPGHEGDHASGIRIGWGPRGRSIHRWSPEPTPAHPTATRGGEGL